MFANKDCKLKIIYLQGAEQGKIIYLHGAEQGKNENYLQLLFSLWDKNKDIFQLCID